MDTLITGLKGSGKSYYAVHYISKLSDQTKILSNIKGLTLGKNINLLAKEWGLQPLDLFRDSLHDEDSPKHDKRFLELRGFTIFIDEIQKFFPKEFKDPDILQFFQMSRHYGIDVFQMTQDVKLVCPRISLHAEYALHALSDTGNPFPGFFAYRKLVGWEQIGPPILIKKDQKVFDLYKSADTHEKFNIKKPRPMLVMAIACILILCATFLVFRYFAKSKSYENQSTEQKATSQQYIERFTKGSQENRKNQSDQAYSSDSSRPVSLNEKQGGQLIRVSSLNDKSGQYIILFSVTYPVKHFPYPVLKTPAGLFALVPPDVAKYSDHLKEKVIAFNSSGYNPNSQYIYNDNSNLSGTNSNSVFSTTE